MYTYKIIVRYVDIIDIIFKTDTKTPQQIDKELNQPTKFIKIDNTSFNKKDIVFIENIDKTVDK